jgi:predicted hotdog family 3-hydroxylacyl-ACP dehydratase
MIEFVAQACAIYVGVTDAREGAPPRLGFLVSCREISFAVDRFAVGDELTIIATKTVGQQDLAAFKGSVTRGGVVCVTIDLVVVDAERAQTGLPGSADR